MRFHLPFLLSFLTGFFVLGNIASAQSRKIITGSAVDKNENIPIRMASITNLSLGKTTVSRSNGTFELEATIGNIIAYAANGYYADTFFLREENYLSGSLLLALRPLPSTLTNVTVMGSYNQYQMDSVERRKSFLQDVGNNATPAVGGITNPDLGFGVGINLDRWSKKEKRERKARSIFEMMEEESYVNFRWNEALVRKYTTYQDDALYDFMETYRPEYQWLRKNPDEEALLYYINSSLKKDKRKK
jgi:hypothetical protein